MFGDAFLVTYLGSRHITARQSSPQEWVYYTVNDQPVLHTSRDVPQDTPHRKDTRLALDEPNALAWHTLQVLHDFPQHFPRLWQQLKKHHKGVSYDIH